MCFSLLLLLLSSSFLAIYVVLSNLCGVVCSLSILQVWRKRRSCCSFFLESKTEQLVSEKHAAVFELYTPSLELTAEANVGSYDLSTNTSGRANETWMLLKIILKNLCTFIVLFVSLRLNILFYQVSSSIAFHYAGSLSDLCFCRSPTIL